MTKKKKIIDKRIKVELKRLMEIFQDMDQQSFNLHEGLINRAAFMRVTLEDYEDDINEKGSVEMFSQSEHQTPYERGRPVISFYNTTNKNYQSIIKQLTELLPKELEEDTMQEILDGLQKPKP